MGKLEGRVALVSGGNSGIGLATARRFVAEGAHVFITGRRQAELDEAVPPMAPTRRQPFCLARRPRSSSGIALPQIVGCPDLGPQPSVEVKTGKPGATVVGKPHGYLEACYHSAPQLQFSPTSTQAESSHDPISRKP